MSSKEFQDLPVEIIHKILSLLSPINLLTCQLVNKLFNSIISESSSLQYTITLEFAKADDNPFSALPLCQKLEDIRSSEVAWATLQPKFIASLPVKHRTSGIYDLSGGTYLLGNVDRMVLQYLQLPKRVDDPLDWRKIAMDKTIIDMGFCVFEHDLIAIVTSASSTTQTGLLDIEMTLLEYSTGRPHPMAKNSTIFITISSGRPSLMCEIVGDNLVLILNSVHILHGDDRIFIWNWRTNVLKTAFLAPHHTYSGIIFIEEDLIILPNAKSVALDYFRIPKSPTADTLKPIFSLKLPSLADGTEINFITCRAEPNPISDLSRLSKKRRAQERANTGMDDSDSLAPKRGFLTRAEDAICIFQIRFRNAPIFAPGGIHLQFDAMGHSYTLFVHRSSFLKIARQYEVPRAGDSPLSEPQVDARVALDPRQIAWADWGPPVSRWFDAHGTPTRWITTSAGQRCAMIHEDAGAYGSPITILDFNPFNIRKLKAKVKRQNEIAKEWFLKSMVESKEDNKDQQSESPSLPELETGSPADEEGAILIANEIKELSSSGSSQSPFALLNQDILITADDNGMSSMNNDSMDVTEDDDDHESMDHDHDIFIVHDAASENSSIPNLQSLSNSDDESYVPSAGYTTNTQDRRHPGHAHSLIFDTPSRVGLPETFETFSEEVEGRLPYIEYSSDTDYDYDGVLLDEERILGITTDAIDRISAIDIFHFG